MISGHGKERDGTILRRSHRGPGLGVLLLLAVAGPRGLKAQNTPEGVVRTFFEAGSGEAGKQRLGEIVGLFAPGGRVITIGVEESGAAQENVRTPAEYVEGSRDYLATTTQYELPTRYWVEQYGNLAHVFCSFDARKTPDGESFYAGVGSFQLLWNGKEWTILSAYWQGERPGNPLPERYRPARGG